MEKEIKPNTKQAVKPTANIKKVKVKPAANITPGVKQEQKGQNKLMLYLALLLLLILLISFMAPVYYVPLFNKISARYGLTSDIARKLTLFDLALNSFGIETRNMAAVFQEQDVEYVPDIFHTSRFNADGENRLINAKETYYHEYERTKKRPAEIAGIYQNNKPVNTPEIDGNLKGVRAIPKGNFYDDGFTDFSYKKASATTAIKDEIMGSKRRPVRGSFDREDEQEANSKKRDPLPDFAASIYDQDETGETQTLNNSRMLKPVIDGEPFKVTKSETIISQLVGDSSFTDTFAALTNFGGYSGALGYYVKDDLPKENLLDFFGTSGKDAFTSYFYSHAAVSRKYIESSKHLSEIAFHGDERQDEILVAKGQRNGRVPTMNEMDMSPLEFILKVKQNMKECEDGRERYNRVIKRLKREYEKLQTELINISAGHPQNFAWRGAPGSCVCSVVDSFCNPTVILRNQWNDLLPRLKAKCKDIENEERNYAESCEMDYKRDSNKDDCNSIDALKVKGGTAWANTQNGSCRGYVVWEALDSSPTFDGCGGIKPPFGELSPACVMLGICPGEQSKQDAARKDCVAKITKLFDEIDKNISLDAKPGFMFN